MPALSFKAKSQYVFLTVTVFRSNIEVLCWPVTVNAAGVDIVRALNATNGLEADTSGLKRHDVDQTVLELVAGQVGADEAWRVGFGVGQSLFIKMWEETRQGEREKISDLWFEVNKQRRLKCFSDKSLFRLFLSS